MKSEGMAKNLVVAFLFALVLYAVTYHFIEYRRTRNGPWQITFSTNTTGAPAIVINQPQLGITNLQFIFAGQTVPLTNLPASPDFSQPHPVPYELPFGRCVFVDSTFLPGTLTVDVFGHEIELLPRVLIVDHQERAWASGQSATLPSATERP